MVLPGQRIGDAAFAAGDRVEVQPSGEGFEGAWYEATVTKAHSRRYGYDVVYATLVSDDDPSQPLRETARTSRVRPRPRRSSAAAGHGLHQLVEVFANDGWWDGVVADAVSCGTYTICFPVSRVVDKFAASHIRRRLAWQDGQWFPSAAGDQVGAKFGVGKQVEVSDDIENSGVAWFPGTVVKVIDMTTFLVEYSKPQEDGRTNLVREILDARYIRLVPRRTSPNTVFFLLEKIEVWHCGGWMAGVVCKIVDDSNYIVKLKYGKEEIEVNHSNMRTRPKFKNGRWSRSIKRRQRLIHPVRTSIPAITFSLLSPCKMEDERNSEAQVEAFEPKKKQKKGEHVAPTMEIDVHAASQSFKNPNELITYNFSGEPGLEEDLTLYELSEDPTLQKCSSTSKLVVRGEESSNSKGGGSEDSHTFNRLLAIYGRCQEDPKIIDAPPMESIEHIGRMNVSSSSQLVKTLPFKKSNNIWGSVNSMEVFHRIPQDPSFSKLEQRPVNLREGEAIGLMLSFADLVDSVSELCISDSVSVFEEKLDALKHFEEYGFDVLRVRERIEELLEIQNHLKRFEDDKTTLEYQVSEGVNDNERFKASEEEINRTIKELEQRLACLYEERRFLNEQRLNGASKLVSLQKDLQVAKEACQSETDIFEAVRLSPW